MKPRVRAILYITGFQSSPEEISLAAGVAASRTWMADDRIGKTTRSHESNGWALESGLSHEVDPEVHVRALIGQIDTAKVSKIGPPGELQFSLVVEVSDETPPFNLSAATIKAIAAIGASLDVDLYVVADPASVPDP